MAQQLFFSRDTKVYIEIGSDVWEIPVLDGFSFSQATNATEIVLAEMESTVGVSRRGKRVFNDSLAPAEWSFSTYTRPFASTAPSLGAASNVSGQTRAVEEVLWALMAGPAQRNGYDWVDDATKSNPVEYFTWSSSNSLLTIDFAQSNKSTLGTANIYFVIGDGTVSKKYLKINECVVNEATIDFDIDGIATIQWSGMGAEITEITASAMPARTIWESYTSTTNFIRNRLTTMAVGPAVGSTYTSAELQSAYSVTLTGGSITISNNITYITPEELGIMNIPIGHVTGNRSISGNFTCYLVDDDTNVTESGDLWEDLANLKTRVTHDLAMTFYVGGSAGDPRLIFTVPHAHVEIPTHSIEDIIAFETNFSGLPTSIDATDEITIGYYAT